MNPRGHLVVLLGRRLLSATLWRNAESAWQFEQAIQDADSIAPALQGMVGALASEVPPAEVSLVLSPAWCACCECLRPTHAQVANFFAVAGSMAEQYSAGECLENLTVTHQRAGDGVELLAVRTQAVKGWMEVITQSFPGCSLRLVTGLPSIVAHWPGRATDKTSLFIGGGDGIVLPTEASTPRAWRSFPVSTLEAQARADALQALRPETSEAEVAWLTTGDSSTSHLDLARVVDQLDADTLPNLLIALGQVRPALHRKIQRSLHAAMAGAAMLLLAAGITFEQRRGAYADALDQVRHAERQLWDESKAPEDRRRGSLASVLLSRVRQQERTVKANALPSALAFWSDLAGVMPHPNPLGLSVESVTLGRSEGRLVGQVSAAPDDPLKHAATLEHALNQSSTLTARGEFETRNQGVQVRMRVDYHPAPAMAASNEGDRP